MTPKKDRSRSRARDGSNEEYGCPGAGTLYVYGVDSEDVCDKGISPSRAKKRRSRERRRSVNPTEGLSWEQLVKLRVEPTRLNSPDCMLDRGIEGYTFIPANRGGVLGRGKFSTVYKVTGHDGKHYALKHTPLHPHHPLIAARLLREPTLLAQLPPHPCMIGVEGWVRTPGHFYLIEQYPAGYVALPQHPLPMAPSRAAYILDQMVSVVRNCLHEGTRVVHRDIKGENVLVNLETGEILLLDLGLGTHYSASEAKLTTCCGSPAFHSPEIVHALSRSPGEVTYYGPELDIWCIALTMLSLLTQTRYPLGPTHKSVHVMRDRALDRLQELDELYPPSAPYRNAANANTFSKQEKDFEMAEWRRVRVAMRNFLEIDGMKRMAYFDVYQIGHRLRERLERTSCLNQGRVFRSTTFEPSDVKHTIPLFLEPISAGDDSTIIFSNPQWETEKKAVSYIKYILRSRGILYHCLPVEDGSPPTLQLVIPFPNQSSEELPHIPARSEPKDVSWVSSFLGLNGAKRSSSVPPPAKQRATPPPKLGDKKGYEWALKCWIRIEVESPKRSSTPSGSVNSSRRGSIETSPISPTSPRGSQSPLITAFTLMGQQPIRPAASRSHSVEYKPKYRDVSGGFYGGPLTGRNASMTRLPRRPHPLSRQVSSESNASSPSVIIPPRPVPKVRIHLSDPRSYGVIRTALDVKHAEEDMASLTSNQASPASPVITIHRQSDLDEDAEPERGRPRSKEDPSHMPRLPRISGSGESAEDAERKDVEIKVNSIVSDVTLVKGDKQERRGRTKKGLLETWLWGATDDGETTRNARATSTPPSSGHHVVMLHTVG